MPKVSITRPKRPTGFNTGIDDFFESRLDLARHIITHPAATFFLRVEGGSLESQGIKDGDLLVVDKAVTPSKKSLVITTRDNELTIEPYHKSSYTLLNPHPYQIWGIVTHVIHKI